MKQTKTPKTSAASHKSAAHAFLMDVWYSIHKATRSEKPNKDMIIECKRLIKELKHVLKTYRAAARAEKKEKKA